MPHSINFNIAHSHKMSIRFHYALSHNNLKPQAVHWLWTAANAKMSSSSGFGCVWAHKKHTILWTFLLVIIFHYSFVARSILLGELFRRFYLMFACVSWANTTDSSVICNALTPSFVAFSLLIIKKNTILFRFVSRTVNSMWSIHLLALTIEIKMR